MGLSPSVYWRSRRKHLKSEIIFSRVSNQCAGQVLVQSILRRTRVMKQVAAKKNKVYIIGDSKLQYFLEGYETVFAWKQRNLLVSTPLWAYHGLPRTLSFSLHPKWMSVATRILMISSRLSTTADSSPIPDTVGYPGISPIISKVGAIDRHQQRMFDSSLSFTANGENGELFVTKVLPYFGYSSLENRWGSLTSLTN